MSIYSKDHVTLVDTWARHQYTPCNRIAMHSVLVTVTRNTSNEHSAAGWVEGSTNAQVSIPLKFLRRNCSICQQIQGCGTWLFIHWTFFTFTETGFCFSGVSKARRGRGLCVEKEALSHLKNNFVPILKRKGKKSKGLKNNGMRFSVLLQCPRTALFQCLCNLHAILFW